MREIQLKAFGTANLITVEVDKPAPGPGEILIRFEAASINPRDAQIIAGQFTPNVEFPLVPMSDGAGIVEATGEGVTRVRQGDLVTPMFFPHWISGEALHGERSVSGGLETAGTLREYGVYSQDAVVIMPPHLSTAEAACYPCAGLTAWTSLVTKSAIGPDDTVLVQGTGGVAMASLQLAKALGAKVIIISSSNEKLAKAAKLGADHCINYSETKNWGEAAYDIAGHGVDAVIEIGGSGTLENSLAAIRHGGHLNIIGYVAGIDMGITIFPLIIKGANLHGIGTGNRDGYEAMMRCVDEQQLRPVIAEHYDWERTADAIDALNNHAPMGKIVMDITQRND
ncbi:MAG: NADPH:quinone reductase-like Zn-dependent oxidoreductase [Alcanivorax sp.]